MYDWIRKLFVDPNNSRPSWEACSTCTILKEQLEYERAEKRELLDTLTLLLRPQVVTPPISAEHKPITPRVAMWSRRKAELERLDRESNQVKVNSPVVAKPDVQEAHNIEQLEMELGLNEESEKESEAS